MQYRGAYAIHNIIIDLDIWALKEGKMIKKLYLDNHKNTDDYNIQEKINEIIDHIQEKDKTLGQKLIAAADEAVDYHERAVEGEAEQKICHCGNLMYKREVWFCSAVNHDGFYKTEIIETTNLPVGTKNGT